MTYKEVVEALYREASAIFEEGKDRDICCGCSFPELKDALENYLLMVVTWDSAGENRNNDNLIYP